VVKEQVLRTCVAKRVGSNPTPRTFFVFLLDFIRDVY
jgi:hypothetical protein